MSAATVQLDDVIQCPAVEVEKRAASIPSALLCPDREPVRADWPEENVIKSSCDVLVHDCLGMLETQSRRSHQCRYPIMTEGGTNAFNPPDCQFVRVVPRSGSICVVDECRAIERSGDE